VSRQRRRDKGQQLNRTSKRGCRLEDPLRERERERTLPRSEARWERGSSKGGGLPEGEHAPSSSHRYSSLTCLSPASLICGLFLSCGVRGALFLLPGELVLRPFLGDSA